MSAAAPPDLDALMRPAAAVADAVMNEGRVLYPYRASAGKNWLRWQWGVVVPRAEAVRSGVGDWLARAECIVEGDAPVVWVRLRWLEVRPGAVFDESACRSVDLPGVATGAGTSAVLGPGAEVRVHLRAVPRAAGLARLSVEVANERDWQQPGASWREVTRHSLVAVHAICAVDGGRFLSAADPPAHAREAVDACANRGLWPAVLGDGALVLAAPIILPDGAAVAPESPGDFCDATEIDELLMLRVLTLTDAEKAEARATDPVAAAIVDRCERLSPEDLARLHGAIRALRPVPPAEGPWWEPSADRAVDPTRAAVQVGGTLVRRGSRVRLRPSGRGDAQDMFLCGRLATVEAVFADVDGGAHVAVVLDDDPGADLARAEGRFRYFRPEELEVAEQ
jgi:hypothetical protein